MFIAISDYILENNGVVYGVGYTDHFRVVHKRATNKLARNEFKGSKYVQSDINGAFELVREDLQKGLMVLFSGTPCQTAGLFSYLSNVNTVNLFVCDIVCHGVPSPFIWRDYLQYIEKKYKDNIAEVNFRDKSNGWKHQEESFVLHKNKKKISRKTFANLFFKKTILRHSCELCKYANIRRPSDITLGDYWGWERVSSSLNVDDKGVSLVLINTKKGQTVFNLIEKDINYLKSCVEKCLQPNLQKPTFFSPSRANFWMHYNKYGFKYIGVKYSDLGLISRMQKWKQKIKGLIALLLL
jgi:coenzyme F420-reducing hydrogenase beta subunit